MDIEKCMKRATQQDIEYIRNTYIQCKSIEKTIKITDWSRNTVHKYVSDLSRMNPSSKYNHRKVFKINKTTGKVLSTYRDLAKGCKNN